MEKQLFRYADLAICSFNWAMTELSAEDEHYIYGHRCYNVQPARKKGSLKIWAAWNGSVPEPESFADDKPQVATWTVNHQRNIIATLAVISEMTSHLNNLQKNILHIYFLWSYQNISDLLKHASLFFIYC